jgi:chromosome segregation ATPase
MARKNLSDLLKEEVKKPAGDESTIDVPASEVKDMNKQTKTAPVDLEATVKELQETLEKTRKNEETLQKQASGFQSTIAEQEKLFKQLQKEIDEAKKLGNLQDTVEELKKELAAARKNEKSLEKLVGELQLTLKEKDELAQKLNAELYAAKKDALQLAEANTKLTAEVNTAQKIAEMEPPAKQPASRETAAKQRVPNQSAITQPKKDYSSSLAYRKHYSRPTGPLPEKPNNDSSAPMWLLD